MPKGLTDVRIDMQRTRSSASQAQTGRPSHPTHFPRYRDRHNVGPPSPPRDEIGPFEEAAGGMERQESLHQEGAGIANCDPTPRIQGS